MKLPLKIQKDLGWWVIFAPTRHKYSCSPDGDRCCPAISEGVIKFKYREDAEYVKALIEEDKKHVKLFVQGKT